MTPRPFSDRTMPTLAVAALMLLALLLGACGSGDEGKQPAGPKVQAPPGGHSPTRLGPPEDRLDLVAPPGYAEDGSVSPGTDWVSDFQTQTGCQVTVQTARDPQ